MAYLLGVDLGTSGTKTVLFKDDGAQLASHTVSYPLKQLHNGWAEQNPDDWYNAAVTSIKEVLAQSRIDADEVAGLAIAGQMHGLVMLDEQGKVLRDAILWCDSRTAAECEEITQAVGARRLIEINANPALTGFTAPKILWVRKHESDIYKRCRTMLLPKDYVRYRLTGVLGQEISDASGTNLLDIRKREWSEEILKALDISPTLLPPIVESSAVAGRITAEAAQATGLKEGTVVAGGAGDNAAAALGTGVCREGQAMVTLGTSGVVFAHTVKPSLDPLGRVHTFCAAVPGAWTAMSCTLAAGQSLRWARDTLYPHERDDKQAKQNVYDLMTSEAATIPPGADGLIYLPYLMGERSPVLDPFARGVFFGLSGVHQRAHLTRAVLEGITLSQKHNLKVLNEMGIVPESIVACGGGATSAVWRQMLADILKCRIITCRNQEGPALGAAILAGVAAGIFQSVEEACAKLVLKGEAHAEPDTGRAAQYEDIYTLYRSLYPTLKDSFFKLEKLRSRLGGAKAQYEEVTSPAFARYGKVIEDVDTAAVIERLKQIPLPQSGVAYEPSVKVLEDPKLMADIGERVFGGLKIEMGYCSGRNRILNALEYHRNSELNIAEKDALLMVAPMSAVHDGLIDTQEVETFLVRAGQAVLFYETTLHYAPCHADGEDYFRMCVVLPEGTNTERPQGVTREGEAGYLTHRNKWLFAHPNSPEGQNGISRGALLGENLEL